MPGPTAVDLSKTSVVVTKTADHYRAVIQTDRAHPFVGKGRSPIDALEAAIKEVRLTKSELGGRPNVRSEVARRLRFG